MSSEPQELAEAVTHWLNYKSLTGLRNLVTEAAIAVPIGEFLSTKYGKEVESEKMHPAFSKGAKGRPKQIDFVRLKNNNHTWHAAYECKFKNPSMVAVIEDICRLTCLSHIDGFAPPAKFFVFAGVSVKKTRSIDSVKAGGAAVKLLPNSFNTGEGRHGCFDGIFEQGRDGLGKEISVKLTKLHEKQLEVFRNFSKNYDVSLPSVIRTELKGVAGLNNRFGCSVWQIKSAKGSKQLDHKELRIA